MSSSGISIGFVPRERFSAAPEALDALLRHTPQPFELFVVDPGMPEPFRTEVAQIAARHPRSSWIDVSDPDRPCLPNQARNLVMEQATGEWVCLVENDVIVQPNWLPALLDGATAHGAGVAAPLILERFGHFEKVHFDDRLHRIVDVATPTGMQRRIEPRTGSKQHDLEGPTRRVDFVETHCMAFRREALERVGGFDAALTAQEEVDISFSLHVAGITAVLVPASVVVFLPPPPVYDSELDYYLAKWDPATYSVDYERMRARWGIVDYPSAIGVVEARRAITTRDVESQMRHESDRREALATIRSDLAPLVRRGPLVLVHDNQLDLGDVCPEAEVLPFLERDGVWWGPPPDSKTAITEIDRMRSEGAATLAIARCSSWWLDHYQDFSEHLRRSFPVISSTSQITAFDLRAPAPAPPPR